MKVKDVMTSNVTTVGPETPLKDVAALLVGHGISGVPVVDRKGSVLGVVSESDILQKERDPQPRKQGFFSRLFRRADAEVEAKLAARTAGEAMTAPAVTIRPSASLSWAATLMLEQGVDRLVVVEDGKYAGEFEDGTLVGILTRFDCTRAFIRPDDEIVREIYDIIEGQLWIPARQIDATVRQGEVTLEGEVDLKGNAESVEYAVARIPGVVSVDSRLTWRMAEEQLPPPESPATTPWR